MSELTWTYSRPQFEHARQRVAELAAMLNEWPAPSSQDVARGVNEIVIEFGMLVLAYEDLLRLWEEQNTGREP